MDPKILAERVGLTAAATPQEIIDKVYALADDVKVLTQARDDALALSERFGAQNAAMRKRDLEVKKMEAALFIDGAVAKGRVKPSERDSMLALYEKQPDVVAKLIESRRYEDILFKEQGFNLGDDAPVSALVEIEGRAAELLAKEPKLTKGEAQ